MSTYLAEGAKLEPSSSHPVGLSTRYCAGSGRQPPVDPAAHVTASARLQVLAPTLASLTVSAPTVLPGGTATGTVALTGLAPAGGVAIHLSSDLPSVLPVP